MPQRAVSAPRLSPAWWPSRLTLAPHWTRMTRAHDSYRDAFLGHATAFHAPSVLLSAENGLSVGYPPFPQRLHGIFLRVILRGHHVDQDDKDVVRL